MELKRSVELACEKGASCWLTAIPLEQHGFTLHKSAFRDALYLRYGWHPSNLPDICPCGSKFSVDHSLSCPTGGYPSIRHNEVRDLFTNLLTEVCHDVHKEPVLQPLNGEVFQKRCTTSDENARLDIAVSGFWGGHFQRTFFDVRVFNPNASSYKSVQIPSLYKRQEQEKKRRYEERINKVELSSFTPIILACTGGCSKLTSIFFEKTSLTFIGKAPHRVQHNYQLAEMSTVICTPSGLRDVFARMQVQASQNLKGLQHSAGSSRK